MLIWKTRTLEDNMIHNCIKLRTEYYYLVEVREYITISQRSMEDINIWELPVASARLREWISENEKKRLLQLVNERSNEVEKKII